MRRFVIVICIIVALLSFVSGIFADALWLKLWQNTELDTQQNENSIASSAAINVSELVMEKGFIYTGCLKSNKRNGYGRMITPKGTIYDGEWRNNQMIEGVMITEKSEYNGHFKDLAPNGYGVMRYSNGSYYQGMWSVGLKSGIGIYVDSLENSYFGLWREGLIDKKTMSKNLRQKIFGIDISHHNKIKDWGNLAIYIDSNGFSFSSKPKSAYFYQPVNFIFVKATEGATLQDKEYKENMVKSKKYNKKRGSYHFMHLTSSSVEEQVENFLGYMIYETGDLPPVLDIEVEKQARTIGVKNTREKVLKWLRMVEESVGVRPIIYTSANMKKDFFTSEEFDSYDFWIAYYKKDKPQYKDYLLWQFTDKGLLYGQGNEYFDINIVNSYDKEGSSIFSMLSNQIGFTSNKSN